MLQGLKVLETFLTWFGIFEKYNLLVSVLEDNFNKIVIFSNYSQKTMSLQDFYMPQETLQSLICTTIPLFLSLFVSVKTSKAKK